MAPRTARLDPVVDAQLVEGDPAVRMARVRVRIASPHERGLERLVDGADSPCLAWALGLGRR